MQTYMAFSNPGEGENYISFRYKVDGIPCPKKGSDCRKGLMFFIDDKLVLKVDVKFSWDVFRHNVSAVSFCFATMIYIIFVYLLLSWSAHVFQLALQFAPWSFNKCF